MEWGFLEHRAKLIRLSLSPRDTVWAIRGCVWGGGELDVIRLTRLGCFRVTLLECDPLGEISFHTHGLGGCLCVYVRV